MIIEQVLEIFLKLFCGYRGHLQYGLCQAGISTSFYNNSLLIGAPGAYTWTGMVFVLKPTNDFCE